MIAWLLIVTEVVVVVGKRPFTYELPTRYSASPSVPAEKLISYLYHNLKPPAVQLPSRSAGLEHLESSLSHIIALQPLPDIGLLVTPDPILDFGYQQLCVPAVRFVHIWTDGENVVFLKEVISSDAQFRLMREDFRTTTVRPGESVSFKIILFPQRLGTITASLRFETNLGNSIYPLTAFVAENTFKLHPISLTTPRSIFFANSESAPVQILDVFSMNDHIVVLSDEKYPYTIAGNSTEHLFAVSYMGLFAPGTIVVRTNHTNFYIPVTPHQLSLFPSSISFGIVNSPSLRHSVSLLISNFDLSPVRILRILSSSQSVTVKMRESIATAKCVNSTLAEIRFYPRSEGYFEGWIEVVTNVTEIPIVVPFRGYALYGLVRYNGTELAFHPSDQHPREISLAASLSRKLKLLSLTPPRPLFSVKNFKPGRLLSSKPRSGFTLVPKVPYEYLGVKFVSLETEVGVVALPASVEDGGVRCVFADSFDPCLYHNSIDAGTLRFNESYSISLILVNTGMLEQHLLTHCTQLEHTFAVTAKSSILNETVQLLGNAKASHRSVQTLPFPPSARISLQITLTVGSGKPQATLELHSFYHIYEVKIYWRTRSYISVHPDLVLLDEVYYGRTHRVNVSISHTFERDLMLTGWNGDIEGLEFDTLLTVIPPNKPIIAGQLVFAKKKFGYESKPRSFADMKLWGNVMEWMVSETMDMMNSNKLIAGRLKLSFNDTKWVEIQVNVDTKTHKLAEGKVDFGKVGPEKTRTRFLKVENPTEIDLRIQPFLLCKEATYSSFDPYLDMSDSSMQPKTPLDSSAAKPDALTRSSSRKAPFTLAPQSQQLLLVPPHKSVLIGPVTFSPGLLGPQKCMMVLMNTVSVQSVLLSGELLSPFLYVSPHIDLRVAHSNSLCTPAQKSVTLTNIGNMPMLVTDVSLANGLCASRGVAIQPCHSAHFLQPNSSFELMFTVEATFLEPNISLEVVTEEETLWFEIEVGVAEEGKTCTRRGWVLVAVLEAVFVGLVITEVRDWARQSRHKAHVVRLPKVQDAVFRDLQALDKKKTKKHKKKKVPPISLADLSPQPDPQDEGTCKKEQKLLTFEEPNASNKSTIVGENMLEVKISDSSEEDDYLDEYKQSGLFSGFFIADGELSP